MSDHEILSEVVAWIAAHTCAVCRSASRQSCHRLQAAFAFAEALRALIVWEAGGETATEPVEPAPSDAAPATLEYRRRFAEKLGVIREDGGRYGGAVTEIKAAMSLNVPVVVDGDVLLVTGVGVLAVGVEPNDLVLLEGQTNPHQNGVYTVVDPGSETTRAVLRRYP